MTYKDIAGRTCAKTPASITWCYCLGLLVQRELGGGSSGQKWGDDDQSYNETNLNDAVSNSVGREVYVIMLLRIKDSVVFCEA
ncbi:hypothetical protein FRX31_003428 [Thalictrum thalictroides]|uniref:Uncharacterized protein n=1 Tax=Thalictrum thalictroides TaxID=46969 RepID=A0A7J6XB58_THATH|nr:hypothetical protein FRX31_003428 [Thalictrum thalictroides]